MSTWEHDAIDPYRGEGVQQLSITCHNCGGMIASYSGWVSHKCERKPEAEQGVKHDAGKPPIYRGVFMQFPAAIAEVAKASAFGAEKYSWDNHNQGVGQEKYTDALLRHLLEEASSEPYDDETGLHHATHVAWNALVRLELILREIRKEG